MQEIAIIELVQYNKTTTYSKPSHAGIDTMLESVNEIEKNYKLKYSANVEMEESFCQWIEKKGGKYIWWDEARDINDERYFPRIGDNCDLPRDYDCWCGAMTHYLLENGFKIQNVGNILHVFTR